MTHATTTEVTPFFKVGDKVRYKNPDSPNAPYGKWAYNSGGFHEILRFRHGPGMSTSGAILSRLDGTEDTDWTYFGFESGERWEILEESSESQAPLQEALQEPLHCDLFLKAAESLPCIPFRDFTDTDNNMRYAYSRFFDRKGREIVVTFAYVKAALGILFNFTMCNTDVDRFVKAEGRNRSSLRLKDQGLYLSVKNLVQLSGIDTVLTDSEQPWIRTGSFKHNALAGCIEEYFFGTVRSL